MGQLLLTLACAGGSLPAPSLEFASVHFSPEFVRLLVLLLGVSDGAAFSWRAVSALLGERLLLEMDGLAVLNEALVRRRQRQRTCMCVRECPGAQRACTRPCTACDAAPRLRLPCACPPAPAVQLDDLSREMENGRLFRLIAKLAFVTDRPEHGAPGGSSWVDTGDR